jgi:hypothetical protein
MPTQKSLVQYAALGAVSFATLALFPHAVEAATLMNGAGGVNATQVQSNVQGVLPYVTFIAVLLTIAVVVWLPRYMGYALTAMVMLLLGNFAEPVVNLLYGNNGAVAAGAELFPGQVLVAQPVSHSPRFHLTTSSVREVSRR